MVRLTFFGSGGGRFVAITQVRSTGGFLLEDGTRIHVDPGPGAVVWSNRWGHDPRRLDGVVVSHAHPDHYIDVEVLIEAMTSGATVRRGVLAASRSVIYGNERYGPVVTRYHLDRVGSVVPLYPGVVTHIGSVRVEATPAKHNDPDTVGLLFDTSCGRIGYVSDTELFEGIEGVYRGSCVLILSLTRPGNLRIPWHLCTEDAIRIVESVKPELVLPLHFGMRMVHSNPEKEAGRIENETGVKTVPVVDGMIVEISETSGFRVVTPSVPSTSTV